MALLSSMTIVRFLSLFHLMAAYLFLTNPRAISETNLVVILGEAMNLPPTSTLTKPTESTALIALLLTFLAITDLTACSLPELTSLEYWSAQTPIRLALLFAVTIYAYLFKDDGVFGRGVTTVGGFTVDKSLGRFVRNDLVFAAAFTEVCLWFWVFTLLRDERKALATRIAEKQKLEENML